MQVVPTIAAALTGLVLLAGAVSVEAHGGYRSGYHGHFGFGVGHHSRLHVRGSRSHWGIGLGLDLTPLFFGHRRHYHRPPPTRIIRETVYERAPPPAPVCRERREFQTTIIIDGQSQPAYGVVCRRENGEWEILP
ncbi:MAG: hypothetical protein AAF493_25840 [Pseudomonadota bacterium]